ncbi:hypothetical protein cypCar_00040663 [Cyprinus carpio]|nr:hypothetical protein cypCar_00040663 [Cyprinus carpio]
MDCRGAARGRSEHLDDAPPHGFLPSRTGMLGLHLSEETLACFTDSRTLKQERLKSDGEGLVLSGKPNRSCSPSSQASTPSILVLVVGIQGFSISSPRLGATFVPGETTVLSQAWWSVVTPSQHRELQALHLQDRRSYLGISPWPIPAPVAPNHRNLVASLTNISSGRLIRPHFHSDLSMKVQ